MRTKSKDKKLLDERPQTRTYAELMRIDPDALDVEWVEQAGKFYHLAEELAETRRDMEVQEQDLELLEATRASKIRRRASRAGVKITEGAIKEQLLQSEEMIKARSTLLSCKHEVEILTAAVRAMDVRKQALENLVRLQGQNYFAGPKEPRELSTEVAKGKVHDRTMRKIRGARP